MCELNEANAYFLKICNDNCKILSVLLYFLFHAIHLVFYNILLLFCVYWVGGGVWCARLFTSNLTSTLLPLVQSKVF